MADPTPQEYAAWYLGAHRHCPACQGRGYVTVATRGPLRVITANPPPDFDSPVEVKHHHARCSCVKKTNA